MLKKEKLKQISTELFVDNDKFMNSFRHNLDLFLAPRDLTIRELSELSGVPSATLNNILYGNAKDVRVSTVVALARVLEISIDELLGSGTMEPQMRESVRIVRGLPDYSTQLIRYFIRHQETIHKNVENGHKYISLISPQMVNGKVATTNAVEPMNVDHLPEDIKAKAYLGMKIPSDYYMPYYLPGEIVLVAADRMALDGERCLVTNDGGIYIVIKTHIIENGKRLWKYAPLINKSNVLSEEMIDDKIGYIIGFLHTDGTWGTR